MSLVRALARPMLAAPFVLGGISRLRAPEATASQLRPVLNRASRSLPQLSSLADRPELLARVLGGVQIGAGALLALGKAPRLSSTLIVASQALTIAADTQSEDSGNKVATLATQVGLTGGALLAAVDTAGKPSLAWRAHDAGRRGKRVVKREARAAKKALA
ncbi:DoxX family protein [Galactobacter caseinivorans]|uniref:DoxX family membrane protein n=1 Tax=Galactobacter caseinivorans TaxID=2676123 RepID=A0A496PMQ9_9MICC|nr:DoxX family membrane protein [Galactobacter caseinivorans]RKW71807.1 DoxX family membrane protein [Galactobacter caseinivorans]